MHYSAAQNAAELKLHDGFSVHVNIRHKSDTFKFFRVYKLFRRKGQYPS